MLLVDDDPTMLRLMSKLLSIDMEVVTCTSPLQALRVLEQRPFDVVCSDYRMPGMNGVDMLRAAAQVQEDASCLLVTAAADEVPGGERRQYFVLVKPFDPDRLVRLVEQLARVSQMKRSVKASAPKAPPSERESWPPPSSRREPLSERRGAPSSERRPAPYSAPTSQPPSAAGPPRSSGTGRRK